MVRVFLILGKRKSNSQYFTFGKLLRNSKKWEVFQILSLENSFSSLRMLIPSDENYFPSLGILFSSLAISFSSDGIFISSDVFFIISRDFFTKVRNFPLKDGKFRKKQADFLQKHHEVAKFKSAENRLFPTNSFGVANGVLNQGGKMAEVFLVLKVYNSFSFRLPFPSIEHFQQTNISSYQTRNKAEPKCRFSLMYV